MRETADFNWKLEEHFFTVPYLNRKRRVRVLLPKNYASDTEASYPVVYFHDGQNVFKDSESYSGHSWGVIPTLKDNPDLPSMIVVGIDNDEEKRIDEYTPWPITDNPLPSEIELGGQGFEYGAFVMDVVKPFIDEMYRTKVDKKHTAMIGSSAGGTISAFMGIEYKEEIGHLGIFSLASWIIEQSFNDYLEENLIDLAQRVYIQVGTEEDEDLAIKQAYIDSSLAYARELLFKGLPLENISLNIFADDRHNEEAWARHLINCFRFLSRDW